MVRARRVMLGVRAPVAQLDRAPDFESVGRRFESCRARQRASRAGCARQASGAPRRAQARREWARVLRSAARALARWPRPAGLRRTASRAARREWARVLGRRGTHSRAGHAPGRPQAHRVARTRDASGHESSGGATRALRAPAAAGRPQAHRVASRRREWARVLGRRDDGASLRRGHATRVVHADRARHETSIASRADASCEGKQTTGCARSSAG